MTQPRAELQRTEGQVEATHAEGTGWNDTAAKTQPVITTVIPSNDRMSPKEQGCSSSGD